MVQVSRRSSRRLAGAAGVLVSSLALSAALSLPALAQAPAPGDILIANANDNNLQLYSPSGTLIRTYSDSNATNYWQAASFTPTGTLVTTASNISNPPATVNLLDPVTGGETAANPVTSGDQIADASVFADGTIAVNDQTSRTVLLYSQSGALLNVQYPTMLNTPEGNYIDPATNTLWVVTAGEGPSFIYHFDESGNVLATISYQSGIQDVVVDPTNSTLWVSDYSNETVDNIATNGTILKSFASGVSLTEGIGISSNGATIYASGYNTDIINEIDTTSGLTVGTITLKDSTGTPTVNNNPAYLSVVPGTVAAPEPGSLALAVAAVLAALPGLTVVRRRSRI